ncbi:TetR/AcrR family transcriptional regulator [Maribacter sp. ANRC-HE7]|uniref:TetR/AcrR family transcriptional regulator n=1 Tax=Maribacter aquimaris TaxID=2737171 RepID=A0ABR7V0R2_9FLAO|nr:TetR/AcrR family transcriptional regulator [Maribacter aquimaris]MBD0778388.1 TetR/AcrR family transcriptional regulator [Maribacter aquimaris]
MKDSNTEQSILNAAITIFEKKGMAGARMQEIADEAKINKAMLHYYFRNKQQLFEAVLMSAFQKLAPQMNIIFALEIDLYEKIRRFTSSYIDFILENPYLPSFIIHELNHNPDFVKKIMSHPNKPDPKPLLRQFEAEIAAGKIERKSPKQYVLNLFSLTIFPFVGETLLKLVLDIPDAEYKKLLQERKTLIAEQFINSISV